MHIIALIVGIVTFCTCSIYIVEVATYGGIFKPVIHDYQKGKKSRYTLYFFIGLSILIVSSSFLLEYYMVLERPVTIFTSVTVFLLFYAILHSRYVPKEKQELKDEIPKRKK